MVSLIVVAIAAFTTAFVFGLGGLGSAVALIPILVFVGVPFPIARSTGLFTNFISTTSITVHNLRYGKVNYRLALPVVATSILFAPVGAYVSFAIPERVVGLAFTAFLFFAGTMVFVPKKREFYRSDSPILVPALVGALAGFISGLLGIGGGGLISPMLIIYGFDPKVITTVTALSVPFSSFTSFLAYWKLGGVSWILLLSAAIPAVFAGYIAGYVTHHYMKPQHVKKLLGIIFYILAIKFAMKFI
ncbi:MAG: sulfite exporter TauE/SafE family protein [Archaeoglobus sp.]|jgi:uncharacterized membrane protein YfcA|nr:MAG: sulfite exporter TauE/SafE family protein [Archaeoglobus sp.]